MKRRLFRSFTTVVALACVMSTVLWIRSYFDGDYLTVRDNTVDRDGDHGLLQRSYNLRSAGGVLSLWVSDDDDRNNYWDKDGPGFFPPPQRASWEFKYHRLQRPTKRQFEASQWGAWRWRCGDLAVGFELYRGVHAGSDVRYLSIPYWLLASVFASLAVPFLLVLRRDCRRVRAGHCLTCGYNLTGNVSGVCPECGTAIAPRPVEGRSITGEDQRSAGRPTST